MIPIVDETKNPLSMKDLLSALLNRSLDDVIVRKKATTEAYQIHKEKVKEDYEWLRDYLKIKIFDLCEKSIGTH